METIPLKDYNDKYDAKLDYQINNTMTTFLRFSQRKDNYYFGPSRSRCRGRRWKRIHSRALQQQAAIGYTWTMSPISLFEARLGIRPRDGRQSSSVSRRTGRRGAVWNSGIAVQPGRWVSHAGHHGFQQSDHRPASDQSAIPESNVLNPKFNYSRVAGKHSLKAGYEFLMVRTEVLDINPLYGQDTYAGGFSKPTCAQLGQAATCTVPAGATSYALADFYFGLPSTIAQGSNLTTNLRQHVNSLYAQDDWRVTPKLTVNLGLRWEFATPIWDRDNLWSNFDPATNTLVRATSGSLYNRSLVNPDYKDFGPRLGAAYSVDSKTSIRADTGSVTRSSTVRAARLKGSTDRSRSSER